MPLVEINWNPDKRQLRIFGLAAAIVCPALAGYLRLAKDLPTAWCCLIAGFGLVTGLSSIFLPCITRLIYRVMVFVTSPIGIAISFLVMFIFYFGLITPIGLIMRILGKDCLNRMFDPDAESYWIERKMETDPERYFQQF